jgi:hypothetical protein
MQLIISLSFLVLLPCAWSTTFCSQTKYQGLCNKCYSFHECFSDFEEFEQTVVDLSHSGLSGTIPSQIALTSVQHLVLLGNDLSGTIPTQVAGMPTLVNIFLNRNRLSGTIPTQFGLATGLSRLQLGTNRLNGEIPTQLSRLSNLRQLGLFENYLSGDMVPTWISTLRSLQHLGIYDMCGNRTWRQTYASTSGETQEALDREARRVEAFPRCESMAGTMPTQLGMLTDLTAMFLGGGGHNPRNLSGTVPTEYARLSKLTTMFIWRCSVSGTIPEELGRLSKLSTFRLHEMKLSGTIPTVIGALDKINFLSLNGQRLSGVIPSELGQLSGITGQTYGSYGDCNLTQLETSFTCPIPPLPASCQNQGRLSTTLDCIPAANNISHATTAPFGAADYLAAARVYLALIACLFVASSLVCARRQSKATVLVAA